MRKVRDMIVAVVVMALVSVICLLVISVLAYMYKWQADKALMGITFTYILAGFIGGFVLRFFGNKFYSIGQKMLDGICVSSIFFFLLIMISIFIVENPFVISSRFLMIGMLLVGSACLGRLL